jgi:hypothetical protein
MELLKCSAMARFNSNRLIIMKKFMTRNFLKLYLNQNLAGRELCSVRKLYNYPFEEKLAA